MYEASTNKEGLNYVNGEGDGLGYYSHYLNPNLTCRDKEEAERAAKIGNIAYKAGYKKAQSNIKSALGI